jgi:pyrroloquinoline quinone biosynthesis protein B
MRIKVLGSAAGGGFPQWNCACSNCRRLRDGSLRGRARTQTQIAFSPDSKAWFLISASPDLRTQVLATPELSPRDNATSPSPVAGVFLSSVDVDSVMGLLHLREFQTFFVFATAASQRIMKKENKIFGVLERSDPPVQWQLLS